MQCFLQLIILRPHPHFTRLKIRRSADPQIRILPEASKLHVLCKRHVQYALGNRTHRTQDTSRRHFGTGAEVSGQFGPKTLRHHDISALVSGQFGTSAWTLRTTAERRWDSAQACIGKRPLRTLKVIAITWGSGSTKVIGNVIIRQSAYNFLYSTLIEAIRLSSIICSTVFEF